MKKKFNWQRSGRWVFLTIATVGVGLNLYFFSQDKYDISAFAEILVAIGTALLAFATWELGRITVKENRETRDLNERIRKEERQGEISLRIRKWAEDAIKQITIMPRPPGGATIFWYSDDILERFQFIDVGFVGALMDANRLDSEILRTLITNVGSEMSKLIDIIKSKKFTLEQREASLIIIKDNLCKILSISG